MEPLAAQEPNISCLGRWCASQPAESEAALVPDPANVPVWKTSFWHAGQDTFGQVAAKTAGLLVFSGLASFSASVVPLTFVVGGIGALSAGTTTYLIARHQIATESASERAAVFPCTAAGSATGAAVAAYGTWQPPSAIAEAALASTAASLLGSPMQQCETRPVGLAKGAAFSLGLVGAS